MSTSQLNKNFKKSTKILKGYKGTKNWLYKTVKIWEEKKKKKKRKKWVKLLVLTKDSMNQKHFFNAAIVKEFSVGTMLMSGFQM